MLGLSLLALAVLGAQASTNCNCEFSPSESCAIDSLTASAEDGSVLIYPGGNTRCAFDDYADNTTTFESSSKYFFQVFPNEKQDKSKLLLFLQGGGACVDQNTCNFALQCQLGASSLITTAAKADNSGVTDRGAYGNPFNDWNVVFLPYCTGDLFVGNKHLEPYESAYNQALGNKQCLGQKQGMSMNGYNNTKAVLDWALTNFPAPEQLVIGGYSAGSLGAQLWSAYVAEAWQVNQKSTKFQVLADSYVGVFPEHKAPASSLINYYGGCDVDLKFPESLTTGCKAGTATATEMIDSLIKEVPHSEWLFIDSIADSTQRKFYELVRLGIAGYPFTTLLDAGQFYGNLTAILDSHSQLTDVTRFNIDSEQHVWLKSAGYGSAKSIDGKMLGDVLSEWLGQTATNTTASGSTTEMLA
ncbi:hypothetical protein JM18_007119 [Phytophthora kernoviae]|uniref:Fungal lipase-like domain-containing protein n=2 Tax=Phytophthora kernoviae TaxID=325452 RepID=A0A8T0LQZ3_9STRA|nr:hypothetical protein G195_008572 [Phytophthora kernoviae 00238/432]KAG2518186.1 hypothetical protein JM16_007386 [Phytophthora kernoviae]KAG2519992.1 hypothetical protein JM18_007119 [Phytophthora kernoviae]